MQSSFANDGDPSTCSRTRISISSFLTLDLGMEALVFSVKLITGSVFGIDEFDVVIGNTDGVGNPPCVSQTPVSPGKMEFITCPNPMRGRYVTVIQKVDGYAHLSLCELQVFGTFEE